MTDQPEESLTADQAHRISAALASARVTSTTPADVVARLDLALDDLVAGRAPTASARVADGGHSRRNRWLLLAGAASVVAVVAVGVPALHHDPGQPGATSSGSGADTGSQPARSPSGNVPTPGLLGTDRTPAGRQGLPQLRSASFRSDVVSLLGSEHTADANGLRSAPSDVPSPTAGSRAASCVVGPRPAGVARQRPVLLDRRPAVLDVFSGRSGSRLVRAVSCDGTETLASARIPAR